LSAVKSAKSGAGLRIALIIPAYTTNGLILDIKNGAEQAATAVGAKLVVTGSNAATDQVNAFQDAVASHASAIVYDGIDAAAITPSVEMANAAKIPVICDNSCSSGGTNAASILFNYVYFGGLIGHWLAEQLPGKKGTIGIIDTDRQDMTVQEIYQGIYAGINATGAKPKIVISTPTNFDPSLGLTAATNLLEANPDLTVLACGHDLLLPSCLAALKATNYKKIPVAGAGGTCQGLQDVLDGKAQFTAYESLYHAGQLGVQDAVEAVHGKKPPTTNLNGYMMAVTTAKAKAILAGTVHVPSSLGLLPLLKEAKANTCPAA
jgi:ABC-type sugar transport system substrate-binding protein